MQRETALAGSALALLALVAAAILLVPGVMSEPEENVRPSDVDLRSDAPPAILDVAGDSVTLQIDTRVVHRGSDAENISLEVRAVDAETGLLADRRVRDVGTLTGDRETRVLTNLTLDREGGYRIETILYEDGMRLESGHREISGVGTLTPGYAHSPIEFQRFDGPGADLPTITYGIDGVEDDRATLQVAAAITNTGSAQAGDVELVVRARQAESNVIADETSVDVTDVRPGRTVTPGTELTVPDGYNYWLDAMLVADGVVVGTASEPANLNPQETLEANQTREEVQFESGDFEPGDEREPDVTPVPTEEEGPGFGIGVAVLAVLAALAIASRRNSQ